MKSRKGFIQIPLLIAIIAGVLVLGGGGYVGVKQYQSYQAEKARVAQEKEQEAQAIAEVQQKALEQATAEIEKLKTENQATKNQQALLEKKVDQDRKNQSVQPSTQEIDLPALVKYWRPRIVHIQCEFRYTNTETVYLVQAGSGFMYSYSIMTNNHVLFEVSETGQVIYAPNSCTIKLPDDNQSLTIYYREKINGYFGNDKSLDFGVMDVKNPTSYMKSIISAPSPKLCSRKPSLGEKIVILGYPGIGARNDITVTEGIISGYDGDFFITSAKVEHGNSGGAVILVKDNCYLGIPTYVIEGEAETLARILGVQAIFTNGELEKQ